ncbi:MAG: AAA family ATPase [Clostridia bacterium]|nr:AAA family ATPase [Clostridia bacterium]
MDKKSGMHCFFFFPYEDDADVAQRIASTWIKEMTYSSDSFYVSVSLITSEEIKKLKDDQNNTESQNRWILSAYAALTGEKDGSNAPAQGSPRPAGSSPSAASGTDESAPAHASAGPNYSGKADVAAAAAGSKKKKPEEPVTRSILDEAKHIITFREALLEKVRGQRHAVEEVVQAIFESDGFSGKAEDRRGPIATFLFVGPSGVGKTFLAENCAKALDRGEPLVVDMSQFAEYWSYRKLNGDQSDDRILTKYALENPKGVIICDEIEKADLNTIHQFLRILERGTMMDMQIKKEVSFKETIIIFTSNAGKTLYEDTTVCDLSGVSKSTILEALRTEINPHTRQTYFPECITTRFANGHVVLFNHLEPYALMQIICDEMKVQVQRFKEAFNVEIEYNPTEISALILYHAGGTQDARTLRGLAKNFLVKELQDAILQTSVLYGDDVKQLKKIRICLNTDTTDEDARSFLNPQDKMQVLTFADAFLKDQLMPHFDADRSEFSFFSDMSACKKRARGVVDYVLLDPACGLHDMENMPYDIEDIRSDGVELFEYLRKYYPEVPVYLLDTRLRGKDAFSSLLIKGARGVVAVNEESMDQFEADIKQLCYSVRINNNTFSLSRSRKVLNYNCWQFLLDDNTVQITVDRLSLGLAISSEDQSAMAAHNEQTVVTFDDVIGCKSAKEALQDFCNFVKNPRDLVLGGKRIPKGVLLYGPPGTGKTMLARAMANETHAAFFPTTATAFFNKYVGEGEANIRGIFSKARKYAPSVIFIDEVDAIGRMRTGSDLNRYNEDMLTTFLSEMDGFVSDPRRPVFVVAATNYGIGNDGSNRVLDPAFVRRFDRRIFVDLPDTDERETFLLRNLKKHGVDFGADHAQIVRNMASRSSGMSNADLEIIVDIFLRATSDKTPQAKDLMDALDAYRFGDVKKMNEKDLRQTAYHEAGHALINAILNKIPAFVTIVSRGHYGGFMEYDQDETKGTFTYEELLSKVCCSLAGRASEMLVFGQVAGNNTGASSDIEHARSMIRRALDDYAMGSKMFSKSSYKDGETIMQQQFERATSLLTEHRDTLDRLTELLIKEKSLDKTTLEGFFASELAPQAD